MNRELSFSDWTDMQFKLFCCIAGCDYVTLQGIGIKTAHKIVQRHNTVQKVLQHLERTPLFRGNAEGIAEYAWNLQKALLVFQHQTIMDTSSGRRIPLTPLPARCLFYSLTSNSSSSGGGGGSSSGGGKWIMEQVMEFSFLGPITTAGDRIIIAEVEDNLTHTTHTTTRTVPEKKHGRDGNNRTSTSPSKLWGFSYIQPAPSQPASSRPPQWTGGDEQTGAAVGRSGRSGQVVADAGGVFTAGAYRSHLISNEYQTLYRRKKRHHPPVHPTTTTSTTSSTSTAALQHHHSTAVLEDRSIEPEANDMNMNMNMDSDGREDVDIETCGRYEGDGDGDLIHEPSLPHSYHHQHHPPPQQQQQQQQQQPLEIDTDDSKFHFPSCIRKRRSYFGTTGTEEETYLPRSSTATTTTTTATNTNILTSSDFDEDEPDFENRNQLCNSETDFNRYFSHMTSAYAYLEPAPYHQGCRRSVTPTERNNLNPNPRWFLPL